MGRVPGCIKDYDAVSPLQVDPKPTSPGGNKEKSQPVRICFNLSEINNIYYNSVLSKSSSSVPTFSLQHNSRTLP